ncbi:MAG TPA: gliding motility-associated C-terminal domain-containing protein, partial [Saprospiraceae bacterium]|nr:gliding motility-associated C-terminal domain-containing protein [Saprospiraceae bacterium]
DTMVCDGVVLVLTSNADALTVVQWQDGSIGFNYNVTQPGTYILTESNHCGAAADTMLVSYLGVPEPFMLGSDTVVCPGETVVLSAPLTNDHLEWQDGSHSQTFIADQSGTYTLEISNECGVQKDELVLNVDTNLPVVNQIEHHSICLGEELLFNVQQSFSAEYAWSDGSDMPELLVTLPGTYIVEISTDCSTASGTFDVVHDTDCDVDISGEIYIPNIFSPDGDGINDLFSMATGSDVIVTAIDAEIFDRWGNMVFSSTEIPFEWNGYFNGEILQAGVFVYTIHVNWIINGKEMQKVFTGDVTLLR